MGRPLVQCKVTAATVNYPCDERCDSACAPGSTAQPTTPAEWHYVGTLPAWYRDKDDSR